MCYLHIFEASKGHLVEALKKEKKVDINIIECLYDKEYMDSILIDIKQFIDFYRLFMTNHKMKLNLIQNEDEDIEFYT